MNASEANAVGTPVLIIGFNRPDRLQSALEVVEASAPSRLYIAVDGPRSAADNALVEATRAVAKSAYMPSRTQLRLRDQNLGCRRGVIDAVSWFFNEESEGIIVEDDSIPDSTFFPFTHELLDRYRSDPSVMSIAGESRVPEQFTDFECSYRFSFMGPAGAWATWRDRWFAFVDDQVDSSIARTVRSLHASRNTTMLQTAHWTAMMIANKTKAVDSWAYPFMIHGLSSGLLTATPNVNLVNDTGVGKDARHMATVDPLAQQAFPVAFPLRHPKFVAIDRRAEAWSNEYEVGTTTSGLLNNGVEFGRRMLRRR